jgi:hypothetical protein
MMQFVSWHALLRHMLAITFNVAQNQYDRKHIYRNLNGSLSLSLTHSHTNGQLHTKIFPDQTHQKKWGKQKLTFISIKDFLGVLWSSPWTL